MSGAAVLSQQQGGATGTTVIPGDITPEEIASAIGSRIENVRSQWPLVLAALREQGIGDRATQIAAAATVGVEAHIFLPIEEYRNADGSIPWYWHNYDGGAEYHGRGLIQLTHRYNYQHYGDILGVDLVAMPWWALDHRTSARVLALFFAEHGIAAMAQAGDWRAVRRTVNGGYNGLDEFIGYVQALGG